MNIFLRTFFIFIISLSLILYLTSFNEGMEVLDLKGVYLKTLEKQWITFYIGVCLIGGYI